MTDTAFPDLGHVYKADYGDPVFRVALDADGKVIRWAPFASKTSLALKGDWTRID